MTNPRLKFFLKSPIGYLLVALVVIAAAATTYYLYNRYQETQKLLQNPAVAAQKEVKDLIEKVGKLIELPTNETPQLATVSDFNKLKDQPFFKNAQNGDKVLIYTKAKKAILYRPSTNKIIEVAPVNLGQSQPQSQTQTPTKAPVNVVIYNGTTTVGLGGQIEKQITAKIQNVSVSDVSNAKKSNYKKTTVLDLTGNSKDTVQQIATLLQADVISQLPAGETKPNADILVIVGK